VIVDREGIPGLNSAPWAAGRWLWTIFAHEIFAVRQPTVPTLSIIYVAVGALVPANLAATIPGLEAARTPTAVLVHAE